MLITFHLYGSSFQDANFENVSKSKFNIKENVNDDVDCKLQLGN